MSCRSPRGRRLPLPRCAPQARVTPAPLTTPEGARSTRSSSDPIRTTHTARTLCTQPRTGGDLGYEIFDRYFPERLRDEREDLVLPPLLADDRRLDDHRVVLE